MCKRTTRKELLLVRNGRNIRSKGGEVRDETGELSRVKPIKALQAIVRSPESSGVPLLSEVSK